MIFMNRLGTPIARQWGGLYYQTDKNGFTAPEKEMNQLNGERWSHFPEPVRYVSLSDTCELKLIN
jgi:hypothetical protein